MFFIKTMFHIKQNNFFLAYGSLVKTIKHSYRWYDNYYNVKNYQRYSILSKINLHTSAMKQNETNNEYVKNNYNQKLIEADKLLLQRNYKDVLLLLDEYQHMNDAQVLWRLSKAKYYTALDYTKEEDCIKLLKSARKSIMIALKVDSRLSEVHTWYAAIMFEYYMKQLKIEKKEIIDDLQGFKAMLDDFKMHSFKALELNPKDPFTLHLIGNYCYLLADLQSKSWLKCILLSLPTSLYEEALMYFEDAELIQPNFDIHNLLMLGKTRLKMNNIVSARYYLEMVKQHPVVTLKDRRIKEEAESLLKSIKKIFIINIEINMTDLFITLILIFVIVKLLE